ncbi:MAG TPA: cyclic nucleotide-binding domain-containing protein, partial [Burkholderiales bacterium]|nr:cyclic nucleotide-binding domain-containing protein [Burkholderiales bacterium]
MRESAVEALPGELLAKIGALAAPRAFARNAIIVSEGDETGSLFVLLSGRVKVFLSDAQGREVELNRLGPGEYFGEVTLDGGPRSASVMALEETRCAV